MNETKRGIVLLVAIVAILAIVPISMLFKNGSNKDMISEIKDLVNSKEAQLVYIGSKNCSWCSMYSPIIKKASENNDFKYHYFDIANLTQAQYNELAELFNQTDGIGTPYTALVKDGKIIDEIPGYVEENAIIDFLVKNDVLDEKNVIRDESGLKLIEEVKKVMALKEDNLIYIGSAGCSFCTKFSPVISKVAKDSGFEYMYIDLAEYDNTTFKELATLLKIDLEKFGTPYTTIVNDNQIKGTQIGFVEEAGFLSFLNEKNFRK